MAKIAGYGLENYLNQIRALGVQIDAICRYATYDAAGYVIEEIKKRCPVDEDGGGELRDSMILDRFRNDDGFVYTVIAFAGYDRHGHPNSLKARAYESGTSRGQPKRPFMRPAAQASSPTAKAMMVSAFEKKIDEIMNG